VATEDGAAALEHEMDMIRSAIDLVALGGSERVTVGGLQFGEALLEAATVMARRAGVRVVPLWDADDSGADLMIERDDRG
jgi:hypothetical protein